MEIAKMKPMYYYLCSLCLLHTFISANGQHTGSFQVVTVARHSSDSLNSLKDSAQDRNITLTVLKDDDLRGAKRQLSPERQIVIFYRWLNREVQSSDDRDLIVMYLQNHDCQFIGTGDAIADAFVKQGASILFLAERNDDSLYAVENIHAFPDGQLNSKRFLGSTAFIGYAHVLKEVIEKYIIKDVTVDGVHESFLHTYLDFFVRQQYSINIDSRSRIFMSLKGSWDDAKIQFKGKTNYIYNEKTGTQPMILLGNDADQATFQTLASYLSNAWTQRHGCQKCNDFEKDSFPYQSEMMYPKVFMSIFVPYPTPFLDMFFERIAAIDYPKHRMVLFLYNAVEFHEQDVDTFLDERALGYNRTMVYPPTSAMTFTENECRNLALAEFQASSCDYMLSVDSIVQFEEPSVLKHLIMSGKPIITTALSRPYHSVHANFIAESFTGDVKKQANHQKSLAKRKKKGVWLVYCISNTMLLHKSKAHQLKNAHIAGTQKYDKAFCHNMRKRGVHMSVDNRVDFGHLIDAEEYSTTHLHNDLFDIANNQYTWEQKYIKDAFWPLLNDPDQEPVQPCPDVYWLPFASDAFSKQLVEEMNHYGAWSGAAHDDDRYEDGYQAVPTDDIHFEQIGFQETWDIANDHYVAPLVEKLFPEYESTREIGLAFVGRYSPDRLAALKPHHDEAIWTVNMALNTVGVDYEGGGVKFHRYNCTVTGLRRGWMLLHPGRFTHLHEGLPTTAGTRYIFVTFNDA